MTRLNVEEFGSNARAALRDELQRGALRKAIGAISERRSATVGRMQEWEEFRARARAIKDETLDHLGFYLEEFAASAERAGAKVHWARDAAEACEVIGRIARERGARTVVKGKSMASEEVGLNDALGAAGLEPVETDLGEWIIQLAGETPSHISVPAIHKTKGQIADLFAEKLKTERTDDIAALTATARRMLRERFAAADIGVTGVNFGVAETGSILLLENEGNIRFSTSLPRTHVALMGIEKVVPRLADLDVFLKLIAPSGGGQRMTVYQSLITGAKRLPEGEGPEEVHIVLLDNGRTRLLADPLMRQSLACIRCGACLNACPVYQQVGGHAYGSVYPGPIGAVITPQLVGLKRAAQLPFASTLCGACAEVCPVKINIPEMLLRLRADVAEGGGGVAGFAPGERPARRFWERLAFRVWRRSMASKRLYRWGARLTRATLGEGRARILRRAASRAAPPLRAWAVGRDLPPAAGRTFREQWLEELGGRGSGDGGVE